MTPHVPGWAIVIARPMVSSRIAELDAAVQTARVALVLLAQGEDAEELAAGDGGFAAAGRRLQLVEAGLEAERVVGAAHEAHVTDVLGSERLALRGGLRGWQRDVSGIIREPPRRVVLRTAFGDGDLSVLDEYVIRPLQCRHRPSSVVTR